MSRPPCHPLTRPAATGAQAGRPSVAGWAGSGDPRPTRRPLTRPAATLSPQGRGNRGLSLLARRGGARRRRISAALTPHRPALRVASEETACAGSWESEAPNPAQLLLFLG